MSDTKPEPGAPGWLGSAPNADLSLDEIFAFNESGTPPLEATETPNASGAPPATADAYFLDAGKTKYKTAEEAVKGIAHKDALIAKLREGYIASTGKDPITGNEVRKPEVAQPSDGQRKSYLEDPEGYYKQLADANAKGDAAGYMKANVQLVQDMIAPYVGTLQKVARDSAINTVTAKHADFGTFQMSDAYGSTLDAFPSLKNAIQSAEGNIAFKDQLPELLDIAYTLSQGLKVPELLTSRTAGGSQVVDVKPPSTMAGHTLTPPETTTISANPLATSADRKAYIANFEARGFGNAKF